MVVRTTRTEAAVEGVDVAAFTIPTDAPEQDGTFDWNSTTIVVCHAHAAGETGLGYTYGDPAVATLIEGTLAGVVCGCDAMEVGAAWEAMSRALRNIGRPGVGMMAVAALDVALWDLKARVVGLPLARLLDAPHDAVPVYGSGGFTSYSLERLGQQLAGWVAQGIPRVKMKVGRKPKHDPARLDVARAAIGPETELYVDANGAHSRKEAVAWAWRFADEWGVTWFEEPVSSDDVEGLRLVRDLGPPGVEIAAGEYGYLLPDFARLADAVDCLQADVTRCGGITGFRRAAAVAASHGLEVSGHCAPAVSAIALAAIPNLRHLEYFHDHVRVESVLFDGVLEPEDGVLRPDHSRPGLGLELKRADAERWAA